MIDYDLRLAFLTAVENKKPECEPRPMFHDPRAHE